VVSASPPTGSETWNLERKAQDAAFTAAKPGATCESVEAAARKVIADFGDLLGAHFALRGSRPFAPPRSLIVGRLIYVSV
jgi:Metallopeptidase family M24